MSIKFYDDGCGCRPTVKITDTGSMSTYQKLCYVLEKINEIIEFVNNFQAVLDAKENSINITNNRKLSETGDFTGTWYGDTKSSIDNKIANGQALYHNLIDLINTNPELNFEIFDGGFLASSIVSEFVDLGLISEPVTEEIDCGFLINQCNCL